MLHRSFACVDSGVRGTETRFRLIAPWVKYVHGDYGKRMWTYYRGMITTIPQHAIGNPSTNLSQEFAGLPADTHNVLFPVAKKAISNPRGPRFFIIHLLPQISIEALEVSTKPGEVHVS